MSVFERLQSWFAAQCNGQWEHHHGISIETCDNPGWWVKIELSDTPLAQRSFARIDQNVDAAGFQTNASWFCCRVEDGIWQGAGDETTLERILTTFLDWAELP